MELHSEWLGGAPDACRGLFVGVRRPVEHDVDSSSKGLIEPSHSQGMMEGAR